ncbi:acyltransferase family protein [Methyloversatilis sp. RAC08]|uniref:acyltransferase family protein n=1 Tax=Methyloversatilis sp. RAC08 TaxID=1842540 RepID=UPI0008590719|nr:acyltransferase [Methyloversatilis sp. RAC08]AOF83803.1 acyltransferase family protein [Methyloversatilis sp. RAC08]
MANFFAVNRTISERVQETGGRATGFDYMRLILAVLIIVWHSLATAYGTSVPKGIMESPVRAFIALILPMFFALSGFLVAGSLERSKTLFVFLGLRVIRIFPALSVEVLISAFIIGPFFTTYSLGEYFSSEIFLKYFFNIVGHIQYALPGVFESNPLPNIVNGQLWTVPYELQCYVALALIAGVGAVKRHYAFLCILLLLTVLAIVKYLLANTGEISVANGAVPGTVLVLSFLAGVAIYIFKESIPWDGRLAFASAIVSLVLLSVPLGDFFSPLIIGYLTVYLGLMNPAKFFLLRGADYSYGIFLYGFAIQQAVSAIGAWTHHWWVNVAIVLPCSLLIAALSWHFIEKPALGWRKYLYAAEPTWLRVFSRAKNA